MRSKKLLIITLAAAVLGGVLTIYYFYNPAGNSLFLPCPFRYTTGYNCPGCGSQRAMHQLLHGNLPLAFSLNPLLIVSLPLIIYGIGIKVYNYIYDSAQRVKLFYSKTFIYGYFAIALLYWLVRNLSFYPFD